MQTGRVKVPILAVLVAFHTLVPVSASDADTELRKGREAYLTGDYRKAEKHFRAALDTSPDSWFGRFYLGHSLYYQQKYKEAIPEYEQALRGGGNSGDMKRMEERVLTDQLGMSYGLSGRMEDARALFQAAIGKDPDYAMYYYNLACSQAELGDLNDALSNLRRGFDRRDGMLPGETYPDPRSDDSFRPYLKDERFLAAMREMATPTSPPSGPGSYRMRLPGVSWAVSISIPGFKIEQEETRKDQSGIMMRATNDPGRFIVSIFLEREKRPRTTEQCRSKYFQAALSSPCRKTRVKRWDTGTLALGQYEFKVKGVANFEQMHMRAYLGKDDVRLDLHMSKAAFQESDRHVFEDLLASVSVIDGEDQV